MTDEYQDIYIYVNAQGKLIEIPAFISKKKPMKLQFAIMAYDRDNFHILRDIAREPGMIFNNSVWFKKKNFKQAKKLFLVDYGETIQTLYKKAKEAKEEMLLLSKQEEDS